MEKHDDKRDETLNVQAKKQWVEPEMVELDHTATEANLGGPAFDGGGYS